ncbi:hypothetical protein [Streptomyces sp. NPDC005805]|uniref:hypothetical protein n=1 Tax=Streptomyces sp. NPDC005805 TaxID=3157068 RepID=UPI00340949A6
MGIRGAALIPVAVIGAVAGALWWWAVLRLALAPEEAGVLEGAMAASGWGLSLLPVHATGPRRARRGVPGWWRRRFGRGGRGGIRGYGVRRSGIPGGGAGGSRAGGGINGAGGGVGQGDGPGPGWQPGHQ